MKNLLYILPMLGLTSSLSLGQPAPLILSQVLQFFPPKSFPPNAPCNGSDSSVSSGESAPCSYCVGSACECNGGNGYSSGEGSTSEGGDACVVCIGQKCQCNGGNVTGVYGGDATGGNACAICIGPSCQGRGGTTPQPSPLGLGGNGQNSSYIYTQVPPNISHIKQDLQKIPNANLETSQLQTLESWINNSGLIPVIAARPSEVTYSRKVLVRPERRERIKNNHPAARRHSSPPHKNYMLKRRG